MGHSLVSMAALSVTGSKTVSSRENAMYPVLNSYAWQVDKSWSLLVFLLYIEYIKLKRKISLLPSLPRTQYLSVSMASLPLIA